MQSLAPLLVGVLLGQAPDSDGFRPRDVQPAGRLVPQSQRTASPATATERPATERSPTERQPVEGGAEQQDRGSEAELLIADLLQPRPDHALSGQPVHLQQVLARAQPQQRLDAVRGYWSLAMALARLHVAADEADAVRNLHEEHRKRRAEVELSAALSAAEAELREARLNAGEAQQLLALQLAGTINQPLPADAPLTGAYRTEFDRIFAGREPPARLQLIDRLLPARQAAVAARAAAAGAAADALAAAVDGHASGNAEPAAVVAAVEAQRQQRLALLATVHQYNDEIAEYALSVAGEITDPATVASMLVKTRDARPADSAVVPATATEPARVPTPAAPRRPETGPPMELTPAGPSKSPIPAGQEAQPPPAGADAPLRPIPLQQPTGESSGPKKRTAARPLDGQPTPVSEPTPAEQPPPAEPTSALPPKQPTPEPPTPEEEPTPADRGPGEPTPAEGPTKATAKPVTVEDRVVPATAVERASAAAESAAALGQPLYEGLRDLPAQQQASMLSSLMHWDPAEAGQQGSAVSLADCLHLVPRPQWPQLIASYWNARRSAALRPVLAQRVGHLRLLGVAAVAFRHRAGGAHDGVYLHAVRIAAEADLADAEVSLLEANFRLTVAAGQPVHADWLTASTPPRAAAPDLPVKNPDEPLLLAHRALLARAAAVLDADALRAASANAYVAGTLPLADAVRHVEHQAEQSWRLLVVQTRYNRLHADAVVATQGAGGPETLARLLGGRRETP